jgi:hypothetical protein
MRWQVKGIPLKGFNDDGGSVGEPFAIIMSKDTKKAVVLTKVEAFWEGDEPQSSTKLENKVKAKP